jgi:FtsX-like permease family
MNLFQLILKQMRQRALGTWLTLLSVLLGVALAVSILLMRGAGAALFGQTEFGYDVLVGIGKGSPLQLTLNTVYHIDVSPGNIPYWVYETLDMQERPPRGSKEFNYNSHVRTAVPIAVGDTYKGRPIIGTPPKMFLSLSGLREQIDAARTKQSSLRGVPANGAAAQQAAMKGDLQKLKEEVTRVARESTPLIEPTDPSVGEDKKWRYGKPASLRADEALAESDAAAAALSAGNAAEAAKHQDVVAKDLDVLFKAAGAENGPLEYRPGKSYEVDQGRIYHAWKFEAVIGSEVAKSTGLQIGSKFQATHGNPLPRETPDIHPEKWEVVGVLKPAHTSADRCLFIPLVSFYTIAEHEKGLKGAERARQGQATTAGPQSGGGDDDKPKYKLAFGDELDPALPHEQTFINVDAPKNTWEISAILIKSRGGVTADDLIYFVKNGGLPEVQAINPASIMREFFNTFLSSSATILLLIALLVSIVAAVGILVSIYNSVSARNREIAILRALGATRTRILALICAEAGLIGLAGGILGLVVGHLLGAVASTYMTQALGQGFNWANVGTNEVMYLLLVVVIALLAGLVPALKAYSTPVATNLVAA